MATPTTAKTEVGTVKVIFGDAKIIGVDGVARNISVGDKVYAREVIQTTANAVVQVQLADGRMLDVARGTTLAMDDVVTGQGPVTVASAPEADIAAQQARIAAGEDPSKVTDPPAAGGVETEAGQPPIIVDQANSLGPVTAGYMTQTASITFPQVQPITQGTTTGLPIVTVQVGVGIPQTPPAPPVELPSTVPFARSDTDTPIDGIARGNVLTGAGTTSGSAGMDSTGTDGPVLLSAITSASGHSAVDVGGGTLRIDGLYGVLTINPDGSYQYVLNPGAPTGVVDTFTYTIKDTSGDTSSANLFIDLGAPVIPGDDPGGDGAVVTVAGAQILEGTHPDAKVVNFVITLDHPSAQPVQVTYEIRPVTAHAPDDFSGVLTATITIPPNATQFVVPVSIVQDHLVEGNETFDIVLTSVSNATIDPEAGRAQITIVDDDLPPIAHDDSFSIVRGTPNDLPSVLTHKDPGESVDDSGAGPFETLTVVAGAHDQRLPNGDIGITTAQGGTIVMHPDGSFTYTPPANLQGPDTFVYTMTDGYNGTSTATVTLNPSNDPPSVKFNFTPSEAQVNEAGLPVGSNSASPSETVRGTFTISDPDGVTDVVLVTINGQAIPIANLTGTVNATPIGELRIDSFNPQTGVVNFTYELKTQVQDIPGQPEHDLFAVTVTDSTETTSAPATLTIDIVDDLPIARDDTDTLAPGTFGPATGNVITGAGTNDPVGGKDTAGADTVEITGITSNNQPGNAPTVNPDGSITVSGQYGVLTIQPNGDYTYTRNPGMPGGVNDVFRYTLTDGDGDAVRANLSINIGDAPVALQLDGTRVDEAGLPAGSDAAANSETTVGTITFNAKGGLQSITLDGTPLNGQPGQQIPGDHGILTVTGFSFDPVTGNGAVTYSYTLTQRTTGDTTSDQYDVAVTDRNGSLSSGQLVIDIVDDAPTARGDTDGIAAGSLDPATGNVITGAGTTSGAPGADTTGADAPARITGVTGSNVPGNTSTVNPDGSITVAGQYGALTIQPNGDYTYTRNPGTPGGVTETFRYLLTDADGDASAANLTINIGNAAVAINAPGSQVSEAGLPVGSDPLSDGESTNGVITFNAKDGLQSVTIDGVFITPPVPGQPPQTIVGDHGTLTVTGFAFDPVTGNGTITYSYTLTSPTQGDVTGDDFPVVVTELDGDTGTATLTVNIVDDAPIARNDSDTVPAGSFGPETGNVITGTGTTGTPGADTKGADNATVTAIASTNVPGNTPVLNPDGSITVAGHYGVLTIGPNGDYSYTRNSGTPGNVVDTFRYILTDGDGDASVANLAISIGNLAAVLDIPSGQVEEAGLPARGAEAAGSNEAANTETTNGALTFNSADGLGSLTLNGIAVTGAGQTIAGDHGTLTVTGFTYDAVTGNGSLTYRYTLSDNTAGDRTSDDFAVVVTDKDGDTTTGALHLNIVDDAPVARDDADSVPAGSFAPATGNVITGVGTADPVAGNDTQGADSATVTGLASTNVPGNAPVVNADGSITVPGQYGVLTIHPDGSYSYARDPGSPGGVMDTFRYTLTDGDGDSAQANLVISIGNMPVVLTVPALGSPGTQVDEAGLPARGSEPPGTNEPSDAEKTNGTIAFNAKDGPPLITIDGVAVTAAPNQTFAGDHGTLTVTGFSYDPVSGNGTLTYQYVLADNTAGDHTIDDFAVNLTDRDGDTTSANLTITIQDDVPAISVVAAPPNALQVDESHLNQDATAHFGSLFTSVPGADGATVVYSLDVKTAGVDSGLVDVATGQSVVLIKNPATGAIEGHVGNPGGALSFTVSVDPQTGDVTLDQVLAMRHPDAANADDALSLSAADLVTMTGTISDGDGDARSAVLNFGNAISFKDDGPSINVNATQAPSLTVDESNLAGDASASFAGAFAPLFGADGAGSITYGLTVGNSAAGIVDAATDQNIVLVQVSNTVEGHVGSSVGATAFVVSLDAAGVVTLDQQRALRHADASNADDTVALAPGDIVLRAIVTDKDGDTTQASLNLGDRLGFNDDGPRIIAGNVAGTVEEEALPLIGNQDADDIPNTGLVASGSLGSLVSFGADRAGSFALDGSALATLNAQNLKSNGIALTYTIAGDTLTAKAGAVEVFTLQLSSAGNYTFTLKSHLDHVVQQGENTLDINFGNLVKVTDRDGDSVNLGGVANFAITVQDDIPVAADITKTAASDQSAVTNLTLVLDVSGSMSTLITVGGQTISRLDAEKQSAKALIDEYAALGAVKVSVVTFSAGSTALGYWMDATAAKAAIDSIGGPSGTTNYAAALDKAKAGYDGAHNGLLASAQDVLYFMSDGVPNPLSTGLDTPAEVAAWEGFLRGSAADGNALGEKITAFGLGLGPDVSATQLNPIAYNGVTATDSNALIVSDFAQLTQTLSSTVAFQSVAGNLLTDPTPHAGFGADGGWVQVLSVDGKTYVYNQQNDSTAGSTGTHGTFDTVTNQWTIATSLGGKLVVDMDDGSYVYTPPNSVAGESIENIGFTLTDRDGDTASANLRINLEVPTLVVGQNVGDLPGETTPHKVDTVPGATGPIGGGGSNDVLIGDAGGSSLLGLKTNVILILDTSGSMATAFGSGQPSRLQGLKDGVNDMIDSLKASGATDVRVHINHFATDVAAGTAGAQTFDLVVNGVVNGAGVTAAHNFVNGLSAGGFTNYEAGLQEALNWVNGPNELTGANVVNQAIFVSDGQPNTALTGESATPTSAGSLTADQAIQHILGTGSGDTVSEVAQLESQFGQVQAIGMGLNSTDLAILSKVEGAGGAATNTTNAAEFKNELASVSPTTSLASVGSDIISGGAGNDIIYGDAVNTDALGAARGLGLPAGSGWKVFETLEAGAGWTRTDTLNYIRAHQDELAAESTGTGGVRRTGGNDTIDGGAGNDTIYGQEGNDIIIGGAGNDILSGGSGADTFKWNAADKGSGTSPALDSIKDFNVSTAADNKDVLDLRDLLQGENAGNLSSYLSFSQTGSDVTLSVHSAGASGPLDQKIVLQGVTMAQLAGAHAADSAGVIANLLANNKLITD